MSEGGTKAIEEMFDQISVFSKRALDIGCGLGGIALYLAEKYGMHITGMEANPWMVEEAQRRIPPHLKENLSYIGVYDNRIPFNDHHFDLI